VKLAELEPCFVVVTEHGFRDVDSLTEAQGVCFECPQCHGHSVLIWFRERGVPAGKTPGPGRWMASGTGLDDLTLSPSINLTGPGCGWHGFVNGGQVTSC